MNTKDIDRDDLEDNWIHPENLDGIRTLFYKEYDNGQVFGYWAEFRPSGSQIWCDGDDSIQEFERVVISSKAAGDYLRDTPIEEVNILAHTGDGYEVEMSEEDDCYYFYTLSHDGKLIFKMPCYIQDDGYPHFPDEDFMCETYAVIDVATEGFK